MASFTAVAFDESATPLSGSAPRSRRSNSYLLGMTVALQYGGYLLIWLVTHTIVGLGRSGISSEMLVSTGWYDHGSRYAHWVHGLSAVGRLLDAHATHRLGLGAGLAMACVGYVFALRLASRFAVQVSLRRLLLLTALIALPLLLLPQILSSDVWSYAFYGRIPLIHGGNPFVNPPSDYPADPLFPRLYWKSVASVYGPVWVGVSAALSAIAQLLGGAAWTEVFAFKTFLFVCHLANIGLIWRILKRIRPGTEVWGAIFYGWNPLVLFEFIGNCHNDAFMIMLMLIGVAFAARGRENLTAASLTAAGLAKLTGLLGLPVYALYVARQSSRPVLVVARLIAVSLTVVVLCYAPFWHGPETFHGTADAPNFKILYHSPGAAVSTLLERALVKGHLPNQWAGEQPTPGSRVDLIRGGVRKGFLAAFAIAFIGLTFWPVRSLTAWIERVIWIYVAYLVLGALYFNPWYATWLIPMAALIRRPWPLLVGGSLFFLLFYLPIQPSYFHAALIYWPWPLLAAAIWRFWLSRKASPQVEQAVPDIG